LWRGWRAGIVEVRIWEEVWAEVAGCEGLGLWIFVGWRLGLPFIGLWNQLCFVHLRLGVVVGAFRGYQLYEILILETEF
jgi:hypothetical protein